MTCERCLVDQKLFIEKNYFKVVKDFDTEYKLEHEKCSIDLDFHCEGQIRTMDSSNILQLGTLIACMYMEILSEQIFN